MRITTKYLQAKIDRINRMQGLNPAEIKYNTIGAYRLYGDQAGRGVHRVMNEHGGVEGLTYGLTGRETEAFLEGMLQAMYRA